ncbi:hypothetical protein ACFL2H_02605 [Planctomycetota bacterium]
MNNKRFYILVLSGTFVVSGMFATSAHAITSFKKAFDAKYVKKSDDRDFKRAYRKVGCNACHVKGKKRDWLNPYGLELAKFIDGNAKKRLDAHKKGSDEYKAEEEKIEKELEVAFDKVAKVKAADGTTFGELFKAYKFPSAEGAKSLTDVEKESNKKSPDKEKEGEKSKEKSE